ncbi:MAG TPA: hypothetical protein VFN19_07750, partial [Candidatus Nanopelagicales bacterium]|nr:hypothetical protein [Candidatus Nanopelagicales bacterium]
RDTAVVGALLGVASGAVLVTTGVSTPLWQVVVGTALMGAGLGLITTALLVGLQSTVGWSQRGVVTGGVMFSRFLGQSLGAAIFGAITNVVLLHWLSTPPASLSGRIPSSVDGVSGALVGGHPEPDVAAYLRDALNASTHAVFLGLLLAAVVTLALLLLVVPRHFPTHSDEPETIAQR